MLLRAEPGKQRPRSCRTQELARSSAQEEERRKKSVVRKLHRTLEEVEADSPPSGEGNVDVSETRAGGCASRAARESAKSKKWTKEAAQIRD